MNLKKLDFLKCKIFIVIYTFFLFGSCVYVQSHKGHYNSSVTYQAIKQPYSLNRIIGDLSFFPINSERFRLSELKNTKAIVFFYEGKRLSYIRKIWPSNSSS